MSVSYKVGTFSHGLLLLLFPITLLSRIDGGIPRNFYQDSILVRKSLQKCELLFSSDREGNNYENYCARLNDLENPDRLTKDNEDDHTPSISPDGTKILSTRSTRATPQEPDGKSKILVYDGNTEQILLEGSINRNSVQAWSPDGKRITYTSNKDDKDGTFGVYTSDPDGRNERRLIDGYSPAWSLYSTKGEIAFISNSVIHTVNPETGKVTRITGKGRYEIPTWVGKNLIAASKALPRTAGCLYLVNTETSEEIQLTYPSDPPSTPDKISGCFFDFGGVRVGENELIFVRYEGDKTGGNFRLYSIRLDGTGLKMLPNKGNTVWPSVRVSKGSMVGQNSFGLEEDMFTENVRSRVAYDTHWNFVRQRLLRTD